MEQEILIQDESSDKKYFTIIPNYILNHSTANDQSLYLHMKRLAGEKGRCYAAKGYFMERMGIAYKAYKKSLKYLLDHHWISPAGKQKIMTAGGPQFIDAYKINDIWKLNIQEYSKGVSESDTPAKPQGVSESNGGGNPKDAKVVSESVPKEEHITNNNTKNEEFEKFYKLYPRKINRPGAELKWKKIDPAEYEKIFSSLELYKQSEQWKKDGGEFIPYPATWLHQKRWNDDPPKPAVKKPFYKGDPIVEKNGKRYVIVKTGEWLIFSDKNSTIEWK